LTSHQPKLYNDCSQGGSCTLKSATVTHNKYELVNELDFGQFANAALAQESLMLSRQNLQKHSGHSVSNDDKCSSLNEQALTWALKKADSKALNNYNTIGNKIRFVSDTEYSTGITWVNADIKLNDHTSYTEFSSPSLKTSDVHHCKLISPYRALEWIYIDSLVDYSQKKAGVSSLMLLL
jgi:hypothetical protein